MSRVFLVLPLRASLLFGIFNTNKIALTAALRLALPLATSRTKKMVNQEDILSLIQKEAWKPVLDFLYKHKKEIPTDSLLQYSTSIFESEFFENLKKDNTSITYDNLQELFLLHNGKFFILNENYYKQLVCELARQSTGETSLNYAKLFPKEEVCKEIIEKK